MKKTVLFLTATLTASAFISFISCAKDDDGKDNLPPGETKESYIDATSSSVWQYYSFAEEKTVGSADDSADNNALWAARKDWDIAIRRYNIRTNGGQFTTAGAKGGVCALNEKVTFASVQKVPTDSVFAGDSQISYPGMGGVTITTIQSAAQVVFLKKDTDGSTVMPPVYLKTPVYIFRTADGENYYKISFTQYINENGAAGHVKFDMARIYQ